jgi:hypothetical protein
MLRRCSGGFGAAALAVLLQDEGSAEKTGPQFPASAKSVIFLYMDGGVSQVETFDPKPRLSQASAKPFGLPIEPTQFDNVGHALGSLWEFQRYGQSGIPVSDLFPQLGQCVDDMTIVRSMVSDFAEHTSANYFLHSGFGMAGRPSMGAWTTYGLGNANRDLPGFVVLNSGHIPEGGLDNFGSGFLPATFQASMLRRESPLMTNVTALDEAAVQHSKLALMRQLDASSIEQLGRHDALESAIENYELAFRMQTAVPELADLNDEPHSMRQLYGLDSTFAPTRVYGRQCLMARRLVERGVRFVELTCPVIKGIDRWDAHTNLRNNHSSNARAMDQPIAGLLTDLKLRGLLDSTLVIWSGEFGRTPFSQGTDGRDHNPHGFSIWLAGGGIRGGAIYGQTDEFGYKAVENAVTVYDLHATMLHTLGFDHEQLTYRYGGRDMRLTDVHGQVIKELLA